MTERSVEKPEAVLENLLRLMGFEGKIEVAPQGEGETLLHIRTDDPGRLIGRGAQVLESLQLIVNRMTRREDGAGEHSVVDCEGYRDRRKDKLVQMAHDAAERAVRSGKASDLPPMSAHDRRLIHQALKEDGRVRTESRMMDDNEKQVVVYPTGPATGEAPRAEEPDDNFGNR